MNKQAKLWLGNHGKTWTDHNASAIDIKERAKTFKDLVGGLPVKSILEVGCNKGYNLTAFSTFGDYNLVGVDIVDYAIRNTDCSAELIVADAFKLPFKDNSFDLVLACGFFDAYPYKGIPELAKEVSRVTKKYILVIDYAIYNFNKRIDVLVSSEGVPLFWMREYEGIFQHCVSRGGRNPNLAGFNEPVITWWLFEKREDNI